MESMKFIFELIDQVSGKAKNVTNSMRAIGRAAKTTSQSLSVAQQTAKSVAGGWSVAGDLMAQGLGAGISKAIEWSAKISNIAYDTMNFRDNVLIAYKAMGATESEARSMYRSTLKIADLTKWSQEDVTSGLLRIRQLGVQQDQAEKIYLAMSDIASTAVDGKLMMSQLTRMMVEAVGSGKLGLTHLSEAGLTVPFLQAYGKMYKKTMEQAKSDLTKGLIGGEQVVNTFAIMATKGARKVGEVSKEAGLSTMEGQLESVTGRFKSLFMDVDSKPFIDAIAGVNDVFDSISATVKFIGSLMAQDFIWPFSAAMKIVSDSVKMTGGWAALAGRLAPLLRVLAFTLGVLAGATALAMYGLTEILAFLGSALEFVMYWGGWLLVKMGEIGIALVVGLWDGIKSAGGWLYKKVAEFASGITDTVKKTLGIASPSKIGIELGANFSRSMGTGIAKEDYAQTASAQLGANIQRASIPQTVNNTTTNTPVVNVTVVGSDNPDVAAKNVETGTLNAFRRLAWV